MAIADWINLSRTSGSEGQTTVTVTASTYSELTERMTSLTVSTRHTNLSENVDITQVSYYKSIPLTFEVVSGSGYIYFNKLDDDGDFNINLIQYSKNGGTWTTLQLSNGFDNNHINVTQGDIIQFKGNNATYSDGNVFHKFAARNSYYDITPKPQINVYGNIMSLIYGDDFIGKKTLTSAYTFYNLFLGCGDWFLSAENLQLPATALTPYCYYRMFADTVSGERSEHFTTPPSELPATVLTEGCYKEMFDSCARLTTAPTLPATTLANWCYGYMFNYCYSLTSAPSLPATTLAPYCYTYMFGGCRNLTSAPALPATNILNAYRCYWGMFFNCRSLTTAPELPATVLSERCYSNMFRGCTGLTAAPVLPATTLAPYCYEEMFNGCSNINHIECFATDISASYCTDNWVNGVAATGTFVKNSNDWTIGNNGIPTNWTVEEMPFTFIILSDGYVNWKCSNNSIAKTIEYRVNYGNWNYLTPQTLGTAFSVSTGDVVQFKGNNHNYADLNNYNSFEGSTCQYKALGNIMSLIDGYLDYYAFKKLFQNCTGLTDASGLLMPSVSLSLSCCSEMFSGCTNLTKAPVLPATTLANGCYYRMFKGCTSLTTVPSNMLPATELSTRQSCYAEMFRGCTSLTTAPELPATTLGLACYAYMFYGCSNLNYIKCFATDISASDCTLNWVNGVDAYGTFVKADNMYDWTTGNNGIPTNWTVIGKEQQRTPLTFEIAGDGNIYWRTDYADYAFTIQYKKNDGEWTEITSTTGDGATISVVSGDTVQFRGDNVMYQSNHFYCDCSFSVKNNIMSLLNSTDFSGLTSFESGYTFYALFVGCNTLTDASELLLPATTLTQSCYYGMFSGCTNLTSAPVLPATTLAMYCYSYMFQNCRSLTTAPELPATTLVDRCYSSMFTNCVSLTSAPDLPAATLTERCYQYMFSGCSNLNYIKCLATNISASYSKSSWVTGVAATGTFVKAPSMTDWTTGNSGIPSGWTVQDAS